MLTIKSAKPGMPVTFVSTEEGWVQLKVWDKQGNLCNVGHSFAKANETTNLPWVGPPPPTTTGLTATLERWVHTERVTFTVTPPTTTTPPPTTTTPPPTTTTPPPTTTTPPPTTTTPPSTWPDATTTGVPKGVTLTPMGGTTVNTANTVIEGKLINGTINVAANNVTIRKCKLEGKGDPYAIRVQSGNVTVEDCEICGQWTTAILAFDNWTMRRCNVWGLPADGVKIGDNSTLEACYFHDFDMASGEHADCGQIQNGVRNVVIRGNNLSSAGNGKLGNAALFMAPDLGPSSDGPVLIENNLLGGGNYTLYCVDGNNGQYFIKNITIRGNRFKRDARYGATNVNVDVAWSGNVWHDNGQALSH